MTNKQIFNKAHAIAKADQFLPYRKAFSIALKAGFLRSRLTKARKAAKLAAKIADEIRLAAWSKKEALKPVVSSVEAQYLHGLSHSKDLAFNAWA